MKFFYIVGKQTRLASLSIWQFIKARELRQVACIDSAYHFSGFSVQDHNQHIAGFIMRVEMNAAPADLNTVRLIQLFHITCCDSACLGCFSSSSIIAITGKKLPTAAKTKDKVPPSVSMEAVVVLGSTCSLVFNVQHFRNFNQPLHL
jgi:hypothetical protein